jgi:hypothetical protein
MDDSRKALRLESLEAWKPGGWYSRGLKSKDQKKNSASRFPGIPAS